MSRTLSSATCAALLGLAACSGSTEPSATTLTGLDARRAAQVFTSLGTSADPTGLGEPDVGGSSSLACPKGGTARSTIISETGNTIRGEVVFAGCAVADSAGQLWTFTSAPRLDLRITTSLSDSVLSTNSSTTGTLRVESATVRGTCGIDTRVQADFRLKTPLTVRIRQTGQVCGQAIDTTLTTTLE